MAMVYDAEEFLRGLFRPAADQQFGPDTGPDDLPPEWRVIWDERAAIMQYDGGLSRERAEKHALRDVLDQMENRD